MILSELRSLIDAIELVIIVRSWNVDSPTLIDKRGLFIAFPLTHPARSPIIAMAPRLLLSSPTSCKCDEDLA